ncbi:DNA-binding transcriptional LysR family regulator [Ochrobactrum sp. 19YEA23]|uniref:LysR family transcriptional regulator n=1 Tax=Ochrobactrum sp. 19YEA23 TaxID=3039854 RepID=UPI00247ACE4E|nr:DNA-binding transcriptional LysR family regulator [Ochrobactrum sp. 19YEA23]
MDRLDCERMFVAVLDTGSFSAAAQRLGTSSGQASKLVSRLEADLGVQLIKRTTRALSPTEVGYAYYERMKGLLQDFDALEASVRNASGAPTGRIRLTAPMSFGTLRLTPVLLKFAQLFPDIQIDVSFSDRVVSLVDEGFDIGVRIGKPLDSSLIARRLCDARVVLVAAPSYLAEHGAPAHPQDLTQHSCIIDTNFRDPYVWRFASQDGGDAEAVSVTGRLHFSNGEACLNAALAGLGIAHVPTFIAGPSIREGRVQRVLGEFESKPLGIHAVYPPARHLAIKVRTLVDYLADCFRGEPDWDRDWN